jgi:glycosyltransferase involved in cell wall biosynthesis
METATIAPPEWHIVTCEYAPTLGGISDYTLAVATALGAAGHQVHIWAPEAEGAPPEREGVSVHRELGQFDLSSVRRTGRLLNQFRSRRRLFVQWVPHGFGYKSLNLPFAIWLACRAWLRHDELHLMVHEPFMRFSKRPAHVALSLVHRLMFAVASSGATSVWLSIPAWRDYVRPYVPRWIPIEWLPVPSPTVRPASAVAARETRQRLSPDGSLVVGHFSTFSPVVTCLLEPALDVVLLRSKATVVLMGRDSERFRERFLVSRPQFTTRVQATGVLESDALSPHIQACDVLIQPYPDGISARHTSTLLSLSLGRCVVTNSGVLTESFWRDSGAVVLAGSPDPTSIGEATVDLLNDAPRRTRLGPAAWALYDRLFDIRHGVAILERARSRQPHGTEAPASHVQA